MMAEKLKPCPFCGGEAEIKRYTFCRTDSFYVGCSRCNVTQTANVYFSEKESIEAWNTRKPMERIVEQLEEAIEYSRKLGASEMEYRAGLYDAIEIVKRGGVDDYIHG